MKYTPSDGSFPRPTKCGSHINASAGGRLLPQSCQPACLRVVSDSFCMLARRPRRHWRVWHRRARPSVAVPVCNTWSHKSRRRHQPSQRWRGRLASSPDQPARGSPPPGRKRPGTALCSRLRDWSCTTSVEVRPRMLVLLGGAVCAWLGSWPVLPPAAEVSSASGGSRGETSVGSLS